MIAIKDMEMPESCGKCEMTTICRTYLNQQVNRPSTMYSFGQSERPDNCPLVEIVTCKDCKHSPIVNRNNNETTVYCELHNFYPCSNYYCRDSKRREKKE